MKKLYQDYLDTRSHPSEDMLYWFIQRKMTWGQRWLLAIFLAIAVPFTFVRLDNMYLLLKILFLAYPIYLIGRIYYVIIDFRTWLKNQKHQ